MILYFTETEPFEQEYLSQQFPEHDVRFVAKIEDVPEDAEVLSGFIYSSVGPEFLDAHPALRLVTTRSTGADHLDVAACRARGVTVCHVPFYGDTTVAEHTFALILALSRRLRETMLTPTRGQFSYERVRGFDLAGKTLGIVGAGHIGRHVAALARAFHMEVLAFDVVTSAPETGMKFVSLDELLARSRIISLHAPLTDATRHLLDRAALAKCPRGVLIVNTARGGLIDTAALREALDSGQVGGAGLDVLEDERVMRKAASQIIAGEIVAKLQGDVNTREAHDPERLAALQEVMLGDAILSRPNVVFTPHVAFNSEEAVERLLATTVENIRAFLAGSPVNVVP
jgi:D-lactate dehydrogenase